MDIQNQRFKRKNNNKNFLLKKILSSKLKMKNDLEPDSHIRDKVKVIQDLTNYAAKSNQNMRHLLINLIQLLKKMKIEVEKLVINRLLNVPTNQNDLNAKLDDLDVGKFKTFPVDLKILSNVVDKKILQNKFKRSKDIKNQIRLIKKLMQLL